MEQVCVEPAGLQLAILLNLPVDAHEFDGHLVNFDEAMNRLSMYKTEEGKKHLRERGRNSSS